MNLSIKINNILLFGLAFMVPFINNWETSSGRAIGNLKQLSFLLVIYYLFFLLAPPLNKNPFDGIKNPVNKYFVLFTFFSSVSLLFVHANFELAQAQTLNGIYVLVIYFIVAKMAFYDEAVEWIFKGLTLAFAVSVFIALMQFLGFSAFTLFAEEDLNSNTSYNSGEDFVDVLRIWGPFGNALTFSLYLSVCGVLLFYYFKIFKGNKVLAWVIFIVTLASISWTLSRMAFFAFLITILVIEFIRYGKAKRFRFLLGSILVLVICNLLINELSNANPFISRLENSKDDFQAGRLDLWLVGFDVWTQNLFFGAGPGNLNLELYKNGWTNLDYSRNRVGVGHVENYYLTVLFTFGLIPFIFYSLFFLQYNFKAYKLFKNNFKRKESFLFLPVLGGFIAFFMNNLINPIQISVESIQLLFVLLLVILNTFYKRTLLKENHQPD